MIGFPMSTEVAPPEFVWVCAWCKLEIDARSDESQNPLVEFSHGMCEACLRQIERSVDPEKSGAA